MTLAARPEGHRCRDRGLEERQRELNAAQAAARRAQRAVAEARQQTPGRSRRPATPASASRRAATRRRQSRRPTARHARSRSAASACAGPASASTRLSAPASRSGRGAWSRRGVARMSGRSRRSRSSAPRWGHATRSATRRYVRGLAGAGSRVQALAQLPQATGTGTISGFLGANNEPVPAEGLLAAIEEHVRTTGLETVRAGEEERARGASARPRSRPPATRRRASARRQRPPSWHTRPAPRRSAGEAWGGSAMRTEHLRVELAGELARATLAARRRRAAPPARCPPPRRRRLRRRCQDNESAATYQRRRLRVAADLGLSATGSLIRRPGGQARQAGRGRGTSRSRARVDAVSRPRGPARPRPRRGRQRQGDAGGPTVVAGSAGSAATRRRGEPPQAGETLRRVRCPAYRAARGATQCADRLADPECRRQLRRNRARGGSDLPRRRRRWRPHVRSARAAVLATVATLSLKLHRYELAARRG